MPIGVVGGNRHPDSKTVTGGTSQMGSTQKSRCFGNPGIDTACRGCGLRIDCFEKRNKKAEWKLLIRPPEIEPFQVTITEKLPDFEILVTDVITLSGAKRLGLLALDVENRTDCIFSIKKLSNNRVVWQTLQPKKNEKGTIARTFADVAKARSGAIEIRLVRKPPLLAKHFLGPKAAKQKRPALKADPRNQKEISNLAFLLSIALQELTGALPSL